VIFDQPAARESLDHWLSAAVLLDEFGAIVFANAAWRRFMNDNGGSELACGPGANYLKVCLSAEGGDRQIARSVAHGIQEVMAGRRNWYEADYPCHAPGERRWFRVRVEPFLDESGSRILVLHSSVAGSFLEGESYGQRGSRLETLLDALPVAAAVVSRDRRELLYGNVRFAELVGTTPGTLPDTAWDRFSAAPLPRPEEGQQLDMLFSRSGPPVAVLCSAASLQFQSADAVLLCFMRKPG
jgi:PAS domain-containing protein